MADSGNPGYLGDLAVTGTLQSSLRPGEELLWCGRPDPSVIFVGADAVAVRFSIVWLGIALLWELHAQSSGAGLAYNVIGLPFVLIGVYLVAGWSRKRPSKAVPCRCGAARTGGTPPSRSSHSAPITPLERRA